MGRHGSHFARTAPRRDANFFEPKKRPKKTDRHGSPGPHPRLRKRCFPLVFSTDSCSLSGGRTAKGRAETNDTQGRERRERLRRRRTPNSIEVTFGITFGSLWCLFGVSFGTLGSLWGLIGVTFGSPWGLVVSSWGLFGVTLGSLWGHVGVFFGVMLGLLCGHCCDYFGDGWLAAAILSPVFPCSMCCSCPPLAWRLFPSHGPRAVAADAFRIATRPVTAEAANGGKHVRCPRELCAGPLPNTPRSASSDSSRRPDRPSPPGD